MISHIHIQTLHKVAGAPIFVTGSVDRADEWHAEVPQQIGVREGSDKATGGSIDMDVDIEALFFVLLFQKVAESHHIFILPATAHERLNKSM
jgi:hypothetical protein